MLEYPVETESLNWIDP